MRVLCSFPHWLSKIVGGWDIARKVSPWDPMGPGLSMYRMIGAFGSRSGGPLRVSAEVDDLVEVYLGERSRTRTDSYVGRSCAGEGCR
jgi:hypothetical protein